MTYGPTQRERQHLHSVTYRARQQAARELRARLTILGILLVLGWAAIGLAAIVRAGGTCADVPNTETDTRGNDGAEPSLPCDQQHGAYVDRDGRVYTEVQVNGAKLALADFCKQAVADHPEGLGNGDLAKVCGRYK